MPFSNELMRFDDCFAENWLTKIKEDVGENWRLKVSNLKKVVESIFDYFVDVLNITVNDIIRPDVMRIAEKHDENELGRMLQLILGILDAEANG